MSEPTREQIKEAFKKTIERWEKIVEDVDYFSSSQCELCQLQEASGCGYCPVAEKTGKSQCKNTPFWDFQYEKSLEHALAELNFLRKVYIWWGEGEGRSTGVVRKEEKKEEWVDVTEETWWKISGMPGRYWLLGYHGESHPVHDAQFILDGNGARLNHGDFSAEYRVEKVNDADFRILKKT